MPTGVHTVQFPPRVNNDSVTVIGRGCSAHQAASVVCAPESTASVEPGTLGLRDGRGNQGRSSCEVGACALDLEDTHPFSAFRGHGAPRPPAFLYLQPTSSSQTISGIFCGSH